MSKLKQHPITSLRETSIQKRAKLPTLASANKQNTTSNKKSHAKYLKTSDTVVASKDRNLVKSAGSSKDPISKICSEKKKKKIKTGGERKRLNVTNDDDKENNLFTSVNKNLHPKVAISEVKGLQFQNSNPREAQTKAFQALKPKRTTNPKPFRLRTDERGILKEANLERKLKVEFKKEPATLFNNIQETLSSQICQKYTGSQVQGRKERLPAACKEESLQQFPRNQSSTCKEESLQQFPRN
ncbi:uncharacterized protein LOC110035770 [Phalaenopsis equestris]|uniref:uncharacterized protein LOC110035770 n=1 Tax=Phalaenopsis equestris TaxID=78828 RepID=UPI0009E43CDC|nr:uncharacterized protein LOC110035770 [Phalaenopsis equestris]